MAPFFNRIMGEIRKLEGDSKVRTKLTEGHNPNIRGGLHSVVGGKKR